MLIQKTDTLILDDDLLHSLETVNHGFTRATIIALGVDYPPKSGWLKSLIGMKISRRQYEIALAGNKIKDQPQKENLFSKSFEDKLKLPKYYLCTDGSCFPNPSGPGGWAYIIRHEGRKVEASGGERSTTNNRMELCAVLYGLREIPVSANVEIVSDSQYALNTLCTWMHKWDEKKWKKIKNPDLIRGLVDQWNRHEIVGKWVRGHMGHPDNERCDELAGIAASQYK